MKSNRNLQNYSLPALFSFDLADTLKWKRSTSWFKMKWTNVIVNQTCRKMLPIRCSVEMKTKNRIEMGYIWRQCDTWIGLYASRTCEMVSSTFLFEVPANIYAQIQEMKTKCKEGQQLVRCYESKQICRSKLFWSQEKKVACNEMELEK